MNTYSLDFESSSSQHAYASDSASLSITSNISIELWYKMESFTQRAPLVVKYDSGSSASYEFVLTPKDASSYYMSFLYSTDGTSSGNRNPIITISSAPPTGTWTHFAMTWQASNDQAKFYINTVLQDTVTGGSSQSIFDTSSQLKIGYDPANGGYVDGIVDDVRIWSAVRSVTDLSNNYQRELAGNESNLVAYYKLNNSYLDATPNANNLTPSGVPLFTTDVAFADSTTTSTSTTSTSTSTTSTSSSTTTTTTTSTSTSTSTTATNTTTSTTTTSTSTTTTSTSTTSTSTSTTSTSTTLDYKFSVERV